MNVTLVFERDAVSDIPVAVSHGIVHTASHIGPIVIFSHGIVHVAFLRVFEKRLMMLQGKNCGFSSCDTSFCRAPSIESRHTNTPLMSGNSVSLCPTSFAAV